MKTSKCHESLENVLNDYMVSEPVPNHASLKEWIKRYPQYKKELTDFVVSWSLMNELPADTAAKAVDQDTLVLRAISIAENHLHALRAQSNKAGRSIKGLLVEGKRLGFSIHAFANYCELSAAIVRKLDQRLISYSSIPQAAIEKLADAIKNSPAVISEYLKGPMKLAPDNRYSSKGAPKLPTEPEDFFNAIRSDPTMNEQWRSYWLSYDPRK